MAKKQFGFASQVVVEPIGDDVMVFVPAHHEVVKLTGDAAQTVRSIQQGRLVKHTDTVDRLIDMGIVADSSLSRRGLLKAGAIGVGAGIAVMAMPSVAMASSSFEFFASFTNDDSYGGGGKPQPWKFFVDRTQPGFPTFTPGSEPALTANGNSFPFQSGESTDTEYVWYDPNFLLDPRTSEELGVTLAVFTWNGAEYRLVSD